MKNLLSAVLLLNLLFACSSAHKFSGKAAYETTMDGETKILKGNINRALIEGDTSFKWFGENIKLGQADASAVEAFKANAHKFSMIVFGGTWCHDTQNLLPVFYRLTDKSGYPDKNITLIGVDRAKTALEDLHNTYHITNVPTFIVMKDGKEVGRVVEYGKSGQIDKELGEIVSSAK